MKPCRTGRCGRIWWCSATTASWRPTASTRWTSNRRAPCSSSSRRRPSAGRRRRLAIVADGGYLPTAETIERQRAVRDRLMNEEIYPIFVDWETSWWSDLEDELSDWIDRFSGSTEPVEVERLLGDRPIGGRTHVVRDRPPVCSGMWIARRRRPAARRRDHDQAESGTHDPTWPVRSPPRLARCR